MTVPAPISRRTGRFRIKSIFALIWAALWVAETTWAEELPLTTTGQIHELSLEEIAGGVPVRLEGTITYIRGKGFLAAMVQDDTGGILVDLPDKDAAGFLRVGMRVELEGVTIEKMNLRPRVRTTRLEIAGEGALPVAERHSLAELQLSVRTGEFVEFDAVVRAVDEEDQLEPSRLILSFGSGQSRFAAWISRWDEGTRERFVPGARVRVRGGLLRWETMSGQPYSSFVVVNDPSLLELLEKPVPVGKIPVSSVTAALAARPDEDFPERIRVEGIVTLNQSPKAMVIHDETGDIWVKPKERNGFIPGHRVEAVGFPARNGPRLDLEDCSLKFVGVGELPEPQVVSAGDLLSPEPQSMDSRYVRARGTVKQHVITPSRQTVWLELEDRISLPVILPPDARGDPPPAVGSEVQGTGVLAATLTATARQIGRGASDYEMFLQGGTRLQILKEPPWWTKQRLTVMLAMIAILTFAAVGFSAWLGRRVAVKSAELAREISDRDARELLIEERQRLARDLHDTLEQSLTGASLQLDAMGEADQKPLNLARRLLDRSRDELRRAVWDLNPGVLEEQGLASALTEMADEQSTASGAEITVSCDEASETLSKRLGAHFCRIAQEAGSNAIRHGGAGRVGIDLKCEEGNAFLSIEDNGTGFDPGSAPGIRDGHFGIRGMKERMSRLGGRLELTSRPGEGTRVLAVCPMRSHGFNKEENP